MKLFAAILEDTEWEDIVLFSSLEKAQKYILDRIRAHMKRHQSVDCNDYMYYEIGEYSGEDETLTSQGITYRMREDIPSEEWFEMISNKDTDCGLFFYRVQ